MKELDIYYYILASATVCFVGFSVLSSDYFVSRDLLSRRTSHSLYYISAALLFLLIAIKIALSELPVNRFMFGCITLMFFLNLLPELFRYLYFRFKRHASNGIRDFTSNFIFYISCIASLFSDSNPVHVVFLFLLIASLCRNFLYRISLEKTVFNNEIGQSSSYETRFVRFFDGAIRAYIFSIVSWAIICMHLVSPNQFSSTNENDWKYPSSFANNAPSGNALVDMAYYNVVTSTTIGYGDISPRSVSAKILMISAILYYYFLLAMIIQVGLTDLTKFGADGRDRNGD